MDRSAIILAGGISSRFGKDKGLMPLADKPLIKHVLDAIGGVVEEKIVVVSSKIQLENYMKVINSDIKLSVDEGQVRTPLLGALTGLRAASGEYALLLPCDTPFTSSEIVSLLFELCINKNAAIPRWPNGHIEPLQAVYRVKPALEAAEKAFAAGGLNMRSMIAELREVRYVSTLVLQQLDSELKTFFNVNTPLDLKRAELMLRHVKGKL
ncbi:MAG: molybdenum cofactor guanylyltransferase [Candidatus Bathyarchaeia archaeon]